MAMVPLFNAAGRSRRHWDPDRIAAALAEVETALGYIEVYIGTAGYAVGESLTTADGALLPQLVLAYEWAPRLTNALMKSDVLKDVNSDQQQGGLQADVTLSLIHI